MMHVTRLTKNGVGTFMNLLRVQMNSGSKKEVKSCLRTAGGSEYTLCSLAVVCLFFLLLSVCDAISRLNQIGTTQTSVPPKRRCRYEV